MALDPRNFSPSMMSVGPVLDLRDSVANKMATVFGRAYARDYIDLVSDHAIGSLFARRTAPHGGGG